ncbi:MAG: exodeoxyribonuclease V subunit alpha [Acidimicrobiaceae bacterium]|nr:exodeoxyribonuclease V subunit alpha [Acidimicrobiaceae bacterium]
MTDVAELPAGPASVGLEDPADERFAVRAPDALRLWNEAEVLIAADVHVARRLGALAGEDSGDVLLGAAVAVRALRLGHVCVDLATVATTATSDIEPGAEPLDLPWPEREEWREALSASPIVAVGEEGPADRPLRLIGDRLYLDRYWRQEREVAADLLARSDAPVDTDPEALAAGLDRLWTDGPGSAEQRLAARLAVTRRLAVVAGGPGTGKTTTVARILALLAEQAEAAGRPWPRVALAAPTGRAAARLEEAVHEEARRLPVSPSVRAWLLGTGASTIHRLLGRRPDSDSRFRHDRNHRLPHETVIVDETSMVSLSLMAGLLDALRPDARLVLVGDPEQLASVEAGAVLGDIAGPAVLRALAGDTPAADDPPAADSTAVGSQGGPEPAGQHPLAEGIVVLRRVHRFAGGIAELADAIQTGDPDRAVALTESADDLALIPRGDAPPATAPELRAVRVAVVETFTAVVEAASEGAGAEALDQLARLRVLCAHRRGPAGVAIWNELIEGWLRAAIGRDRPGGEWDPGGLWYTGRPLLVTTNDYELRLFNGDVGVVGVGPDGQTAAAFERRGEVAWISPSRLPPTETLYATTVHKAQGSQLDEVIVVLPETTSMLLTRQLLYTAVTRARRRVTLIGSEAALREAVIRPIARASGLQERLWGHASAPPGSREDAGSLPTGSREDAGSVPR